MNTSITIQTEELYKKTGNAKLSEIDTYIEQAKQLAGEGNDVVLTGAGPIWLYLKIAHALHGKARKLIYRSPVTGDVVIFDHSPG
jgi:CRISPR-associated Csx3 family protein